MDLSKGIILVDWFIFPEEDITRCTIREEIDDGSHQFIMNYSVRQLPEIYPRSN